MTRRTAVQLLAGAGAGLCLPKTFGQAAAPAASGAGPAPLPPAPAPIPAPAGFGVAEGPFKPTLESLSAFQVPDWYRDAKFGIWAHWGPQCQPEQGDWYARNMYLPDQPVYKYHLEKYGHPSKFGFKDVIHEWKAEKWEPEKLIALYKRAGAKFFSAMAHHHDNFDNFDSKYQPWNSVKIGPKKDLVGGWMKAAREAGLRFGISSHGDRAWSWYQAAQGADPTGPMAGVPYDGIMTKAQGKGLWWEGLDPQDLYAQYHKVGDYNWAQTGNPPIDKVYCEKFFNRIIDLIDKYQPDLLYFDDTVMPIYPTSDVGPRIAAYLYNTNLARNGKLEAVMTGKDLTGNNAAWRKALVYDLENGISGGAETLPWQTDTCIGSWHYKRSRFEQHQYKPAPQVIHMLVDIVSKNGNLMLSIPVRGEGTIDDDEVKILESVAAWMGVNSEGIYGTRPWKTYGEGPTQASSRTQTIPNYTSRDIRFTTKGDALYAFVMAWPESREVVIKALAANSQQVDARKVAEVSLLGYGGKLEWSQTADGLAVKLPEKAPSEPAVTLRIKGLLA
ncbi:MAG: alpha-L-fucosidase [Verrucomicrobiota bacterium]